MTTDAVKAAMKLEDVLRRLPPDVAKRALDMVWFFHIGHQMDWRPCWMRLWNDRKKAKS